jgi:putative oxidoreductase
MSDQISAADHHQPPRLLSWVFPARYPFAELAPIPLRLIVGYGFLAHGLAKLGRGPEHFAGILDAISVPFPYWTSVATIAVEIFGGLAILLGAFVTLAAVPMIVVLLVATFTVHWPYGFSSIKLLSVTGAGAQFGPPGYECDLLYVACIMALLMLGPGPLAVDTFVARRMKSSS